MLSIDDGGWRMTVIDPLGLQAGSSTAKKRLKNGRKRYPYGGRRNVHVLWVCLCLGGRVGGCSYVHNGRPVAREG